MMARSATVPFLPRRQTRGLDRRIEHADHPPALPSHLLAGRRGATLSDQYETPLNLAAMLALGGAKSHISKHLVNLLRSDDEISREVRDVLADALEGNGPSGLAIKVLGTAGGRGKTPLWESLESRRKLVRIALEIEAAVSSGMTISEAMVSDVSSEAGRDATSTRKQSWAYFKRMNRWLETYRPAPLPGLSEEQSARLHQDCFHFLDINGDVR